MEVVSLSRPYAKAIFEIAAAESSFEKWYNNLSLLAYLLKQDNVLGYVQQPQLSNAEKAECIISLAADEFCVKFKNLVHILFAKNRILLAQHITDIYVSLVRENNNSIKAEIETAHELEQNQLSAIEGQLKAVLQKDDLDISVQINRDLLGGVIIKVGDLVIDNSLRGRISQLGKSIVS